MTIKEETEVIVATGLSVSLPNMAAKRRFRAAPLTPIFREINLRASAGQCLGIVGESGSGKTTLGRTLVRLLRPTSGTLLFQGRDITSLSEPELRPIRNRMQIIFQEPRAALNPRRRVDDAVSQPLLVYGKVLNSREAREQAADLLHQVGLDPILGRRYPRELSGGQLQRVCIARAISVRPALIVADEIVSGLDMSSQAQVLNLLDELRQQLGLCLVFISHDLSVVRSICDQVIVLLDGRTVESGPVAKIFSQPRRRYTQSLIEAVPLPEPDRDWLKATTDTT
ncbi:MAG: ABC transporter ATP-binding protein, partial [Acidiferrobacteraceae bacterium]|nr:ABC transporter ATP-binding protein [Acidiferrobacteraceae bacterium]